MSLTLVGIITSFNVPFNNCPVLLYPNVYISPFVVSNIVCLSPAEIYPIRSSNSNSLKVLTIDSPSNPN